MPRHRSSVDAEMIGQFSFADVPCDRHVAVRLGWRAGEPVARIETPAEVAHELPFHVPVDDEYMALAIALGYAVVISGLSQTEMTLTGDATAWPAHWGALSVRPIPKYLTS